QTQVVTAKTVDEAIEVAMHELDAARDEVEVEVLSRGKTGFLGIGSELAKIRVRKLTAQEDAGPRTMGVVSKILELLGSSAVCTLRNAHDPQSGGPQIDIEGDDAGLLIGRRGETLRALQFVVNVIVNKDREDSVRVLLDVEEYRARRQRALSELAERVADKVAATGRSITLESMPPAERRIIHLALADNPRVTTESTGWGTDRRVSINPKRN
ncbi:MAG: RNA-binding cell elongation regulator Jag/EloR, partial [Dehalococcoidia bacterium]